MNISGETPTPKEKLSLDWSGGKKAREADQRDGTIAVLWAMGLDTVDIAKRMGPGTPESVVANRLAVIRDQN